MSPRRFLGIDPGLNGGAASIEGNKIETAVIPTRREGKKRVLDHWKLSVIFAGFDCKETFAVVEQQQAMPKQGVVSMLTLGYIYGSIIQCLVDYMIPFETVRPHDWQREFGISAKNGDTKEQALKICQKLFPEANLLATKRSRKLHDGIVDALLICEWNRRHYKGQLKNR